jgi:flagellar M-ring protein FliF
MNALTESLRGWNRGARHGAAACVVLILAAAVGLGWWAYRADYQVLFADLAVADAAAMTKELERAKVPFQLADEGRTILVPKDAVHRTRLKLMGSDVALHGAVGFEVFNSTDFGMSEFVQKVNYQRAVQGELTRTIQSIEGVQAVRVHLAVPEQGLFKKASAQPKASITVALKRGHSLAPTQVAGIQRLVAAAIPDMTPANVTVLDHLGVALTRPGTGEPAAESGMQLDAKRATEEYLLRKIHQVLERTFGVNGAIASVDVLLNLDQVRVTTEDVMPAKANAQAGVTIRERQTSRDGRPGGAGKDAEAGTVTSIESEYQVGRRVEQVVSAPGTIERMTIAVVVKESLTDAQIGKLKEVVGSASGFNADRGDAIVISSLDRVGPAPTAQPLPVALELSSRPAELAGFAMTLPRADGYGFYVAGTLLLIAGCAGAFQVTARRRPGRGRASVALTQAERERMLEDVRLWVSQSPGAAEKTEVAP